MGGPVFACVIWRNQKGEAHKLPPGFNDVKKSDGLDAFLFLVDGMELATKAAMIPAR